MEVDWWLVDEPEGLFRCLFHRRGAELSGCTSGAVFEAVLGIRYVN